jgi:hypothetical protein
VTSNDAGKSLNEILGNHREKPEQSRMELGGCVSAVDSRGQTIFIADAHRGDGKRCIVRADDKPGAFAELEAEISHVQASAKPVTA